MCMTMKRACFEMVQTRCFPLFTMSVCCALLFLLVASAALGMPEIVLKEDGRDSWGFPSHLDIAVKRPQSDADYAALATLLAGHRAVDMADVYIRMAFHRLPAGADSVPLQDLLPPAVKRDLQQNIHANCIGTALAVADGRPADCTGCEGGIFIAPNGKAKGIVEPQILERMNKTGYCPVTPNDPLRPGDLVLYFYDNEKGKEDLSAPLHAATYLGNVGGRDLLYSKSSATSYMGPSKFNYRQKDESTWYSHDRKRKMAVFRPSQTGSPKCPALQSLNIYYCGPSGPKPCPDQLGPETFLEVKPPPPPPKAYTCLASSASAKQPRTFLEKVIDLLTGHY